MLDDHGVVTWHTPNAPTMLGLTDLDIVGSRYVESTTLDGFDDVVSGGRDQRHPIRLPDGSTRDLLAGVHDLRPDPAVGGWVVVVQDLEANPGTSDFFSRRATRDVLTGLPTRELLMEHLNGALARSRRRATPAAVLFLDLDGFKEVNDRLGHDAGDALLVEVAKRLQDTVRASDLVARLGGDEFVVVLEGLSHAADAKIVADKIVAVLGEPVAVNHAQAHVGASIGIAVSTDPEDGAESLLTDADAAMYYVKHSGKNGSLDFGELLRSVAADRNDLRASLEKALVADHLEVAYEAVVGLTEGRAEGFLVSLRWRHPERGLLVSDDWLRLAQQVGMASAIDDWLLRRTCEQSRLWGITGHEVVSWLPVDAHQVLRAGFTDTVAEALRTTGAEPGDLGICVTEDAVARNPATVARVLDELDRVGVHLAIHEYRGHGVSPDLMQEMPLDSVIFDGDVVGRVGHDQRASRSMAGLVSMARHLDVRVVATNVDNPTQLATVLQLRCHAAAGAIFATADLSPAATAALRHGHGWNLPVRMPDAATSGSIVGLGSPASARIPDAGPQGETPPSSPELLSAAATESSTELPREPSMELSPAAVSEAP